jgi:hypothetical protein
MEAEDRIKSMRKEVDRTKNELSREEGTLSALLKQAKDDFGLGSEGEVSSELDKLRAKATTMQSEIRDGIAAIDADWDFQS